MQWIIYCDYEMLESDKCLEVLYDSDLLFFIRILNNTIKQGLFVHFKDH